MSKPAVTYMKREWKKVLPVFILSVCYVAFVFILVFITLKGANGQFRLGMAYPDEYMSFEIGDIFLTNMSGVLEGFHGFVIIIFEAMLIRKVFYQENRAGVSDFLRILPIRERNKMAMKVFAGESVIFGFSLFFGIFGSITNALLNTGLTEIAEVMPIDKVTSDGVVADTYQMIWQTSGMMFLALSAMFLVLFVMQCCVHNMPVAMFTGFGILLVPFYYTSIYDYISVKQTHMYVVAASFLSHYPMINYNEEGMDYLDFGIEAYTVEWRYMGEMILFLSVVILLAVAMLALVLRLRWNIKESNNRMVNSPAVAEFIITGLSISVGTAVAYITGNVPYAGAETAMEKYGFYIVTFIVGSIVWALIHGIGMAVMKRHQGA